MNYRLLFVLANFLFAFGLGAAHADPILENVSPRTHARMPDGLKLVCNEAPDTLSASPTCPVIRLDGLTYWAYSHIDNRKGMTIVGYDQAGNVVNLFHRNGARYLWKITTDSRERTVQFWGQGNRGISISWDQLAGPIDNTSLIPGETNLTENVHGSVTASGLQYSVLRTGFGARPKASDSVIVHYRGTTVGGKEFDSSYARNTPAEFPLNRVIAGWTEGLQLMNVGSKFKFIIPSELAYGENGAGKIIGPNETLIFEIELLGINGITAGQPVPSTEEVFDIVEDAPIFCSPGEKNLEAEQCGMKNLAEYIKRNFKYPKIARENGVEGSVYVRFTVNKNGYIRDSKVVIEIGANCGVEALRVIDSMKNKPGLWKPGLQRGKPVNTSLVVPIRCAD
jgi:FKBP-type peptidyl-prolyl cis-trans isomerase FkpA